MSERRTLLVVDDSPLFRELERHFLARYGHVLEAANAGEALAAVRRESPALALVDLSLPDLPGDELCRQIHREPGRAHMPVLAVVSGEASEHARAVRAGAADVLAKPLSRGAIVTAVPRFLLGPDPRGLPRVELETRVEVMSGRRQLQGRARNVSRGGMFVELPEAPAPGEELALRFSIAACGAEPFVPTARVAWVRDGRQGGPAGVGLRFLALDGQSARRLDGFVHERFQGPVAVSLRCAENEP